MTRDDVKNRILARRARFVAIAVASAGIAGIAGIASGMQACGGSTESGDAAITDGGAEACLSPPLDASEEAQVCLSVAPDAGPDACLKVPFDAGPGVCLSILEDAGSPHDAAPQPCLSLPPD